MRRDGLLSLPKLLIRSETQVFQSWIWTQITDIICEIDNRFARCHFFCREQLFSFIFSSNSPGHKNRKNARSSIEQVLGVTPQKAAAIRPRTTYHESYQRITRHAGHCWRSRDELISDVLLWTPSQGKAEAERPACNYIQQLCEDTGCSPEDLSEAMNDREGWREKVRDIRADGTISWWWWCWWDIYSWLSM